MREPKEEVRQFLIFDFLMSRGNKLLDMGLELAYNWIIFGKWYKKSM